MALTSPITITINAVEKAVVKINQDGYGSHYRYASSTEVLDLRIRHAAEKADAKGTIMHRHNVSLTWTVFSVDPDEPNQVTEAYAVLRNASTDLGTSLPYLTVALADLLKVSGNVAALAGWQN